MNVQLRTQFSSTVMQDKRKPYDRHTKFKPEVFSVTLRIGIHSYKNYDQISIIYALIRLFRARHDGT